MLRSVDRFLGTRSRWQLTALSLASVGVIGLLDHLSGYELSFSIFYLIPVSLATWYLGKRHGLVLAFASAVTWLVIDLTSGHVVSNASIPAWNAAVRLGFFVIVAYLLARSRAALDVQALLARQDGLTGCLNGRAFREHYETLAPICLRHGRPMALGYLDLDGFKGVNDAFGHEVGDRVLEVTARTVASRLRASDLFGRLGGDEFAILLPETDDSGARKVFEGLHESLVEMASRNCWGVGFSIGVVVFDSPPVSAETALLAADQLMYQVKRTGKNTVAFQAQGGLADTVVWPVV